jgi:hypothetical protein
MPEDGSTTKLKLEVESLDTVPEAARALYVPTDDGKRYRLDMVRSDPAEAKAELKAMREEAARLRVEVREEKKQLRETFGTDDFDQIKAKVLAFREEEAKLAKADAEREAAHEAKVAELERVHGERLAPVTARAERF